MPSATLSHRRSRASSAIAVSTAEEHTIEKSAAQRVDPRHEADPAQLAHRIVEIASDKKGNEIVMLRTAELTTMADYFVICSGRTDRQVKALTGALLDTLRDEGIRPLGVEGADSARWVLVDFGSVIVHVFAPEERAYYALERLWAQAPAVVRVV